MKQITGADNGGSSHRDAWWRPAQVVSQVGAEDDEDDDVDEEEEEDVSCCQRSCEPRHCSEKQCDVFAQGSQSIWESLIKRVWANNDVLVTLRSALCVRDEEERLFIDANVRMPEGFRHQSQECDKVEQPGLLQVSDFKCVGLFSV